ncbi:PAO, partial [Symbiodinium sp. CCMP2592]
MAAGKDGALVVFDVAISRAAAAGGPASFLIIAAVAQALQQLVLIVLQVVVAASAQLRSEVSGIFDANCGYLVSSTDLTAESCPNYWHAPLDVMAMLLLVCGIVMSFVFFFVVPFRKFMSAAPSRWLGRLLWRSLRRPKLVSGEKEIRWPTSLWPLSGIAITLGVWNDLVVEVEDCSGRQELMEGTPREEDRQADRSEVATGANFSLVSWRAMSDASWRLMALCWLPIPVMGPFLCKAAEYLNSHTLLAVGRDGPALAAKLKEVPSVSFESVHGRDERSLRSLFLQ